jgi:hypothetical protein
VRNLAVIVTPAGDAGMHGLTGLSARRGRKSSSSAFIWSGAGGRVSRGLGARPGQFWGRHLAVVDALLAEESDRVTRQAGIRLAAARAAFADRRGDEEPEARHAVMRFSEMQEHTKDQQLLECPACGGACRKRLAPLAYGRLVRDLARRVA